MDTLNMNTRNQGKQIADIYKQEGNGNPEEFTFEIACKPKPSLKGNYNQSPKER